MPLRKPSFAALIQPDLLRVYRDEMAQDVEEKIRQAMRAQLDAEVMAVFKDAKLRFPQNPLDKPAKTKTHGWALVGPVTCVRDSVRALCVRFEGVDTWVPRSQLHATENEIKKQGDQGMLILPLWLAQEKGWIP